MKAVTSAGLATASRAGLVEIAVTHIPDADSGNCKKRALVSSQSPFVPNRTMQMRWRPPSPGPAQPAGNLFRQREMICPRCDGGVVVIVNPP
jgi:hypothetical protein